MERSVERTQQNGRPAPLGQAAMGWFAPQSTATFDVLPHRVIRCDVFHVHIRTCHVRRRTTGPSCSVHSISQKCPVSLGLVVLYALVLRTLNTPQNATPTWCPCHLPWYMSNNPYTCLAKALAVATTHKRGPWRDAREDSNFGITSGPLDLNAALLLARHRDRRGISSQRAGDLGQHVAQL